MVDLLEDQGRLMRKQNEVVRSQRDSAARGLVFYIVVGLGSALSGIATWLGLTDQSDKTWSLILLGIVAGGALLGYHVVSRQQKRDDDDDQTAKRSR